MKTRNGFVSNSSSSSFIVSVKKDKDACVWGKTDDGKKVKIDLTNIGEEAYTIEDLKDLFLDVFLFDIDEILDEECYSKEEAKEVANRYQRGIENYNICIEEIKKGRYIIAGLLHGGEFTDDEPDCGEYDEDALLYNNAFDYDPKKIKIIDEEAELGVLSGKRPMTKKEYKAYLKKQEAKEE